MNKKNVSKPVKLPKIRQDRDYDCVYVRGKKIMLGRTGSPEAETAYRQLQVQILTDPTFSAPKSQQVTVDCLCFAYLEYVEEHDPGHYSCIKTAVGILVKHFASQSVDTLDSRSWSFWYSLTRIKRTLWSIHLWVLVLPVLRV